MCAAGASDLHLSVGSPPMIRKDGRMEPLDSAAAALTVRRGTAGVGPMEDGEDVLALRSLRRTWPSGHHLGRNSDPRRSTWHDLAWPGGSEATEQRGTKSV